MGDKSPKATRKQANQKQARQNAADKKKKQEEAARQVIKPNK